MSASRRLSPLVVGLALFSMFFGSGNLIFPLFMGQIAEGQWLLATLGFVLMGVLVPFSGVVAMVLYEGNYGKFFGILGERGGLLFSLILLTVWIPLGSGPRCAILAYAGLKSYLTLPPLWVFSLIYTALIYWIVARRSRMLDILGRYLTPALLLCLGLIVGYGVWGAPSLGDSDLSSGALVLRGILEGYNTMDLIAAFFFSASIISMIQKARGDSANSLRFAFRSCMIGMSVLAVVYLGLIYVAAAHAKSLVGIPKDQLLSELAKLLLGPRLGIISSLAIALACLSTSVALVNVYSEFLQKMDSQKMNRQRSLLFTLGISFIMSIFGLQGVTAITSPLLQIFYPSLILLILWNTRLVFRQKTNLSHLT